ncbi:MAG: hypothetical protein ACHQLA_00085 [Ignavibacteriales bacterium]
MKQKSVINHTKYFLKSWVVMLFSFTLMIVQPVIPQSTSGDKEGDIAENVKFTVINKKIYINYDLPGNSNQLYDVSLILKRISNSEAVYEPITVSGDIGEGRHGGKNKLITWDMQKDFPGGLSGEDFYFVVRAEKITEESNLLMWAGIGLATVAAVVTYVVVGGAETESSEQDPGGSGSFPPPPGRP